MVMGKILPSISYIEWVKLIRDTKIYFIQSITHAGVGGGISSIISDLFSVDL
jgi:hypothetical protein